MDLGALLGFEGSFHSVSMVCLNEAGMGTVRGLLDDDEGKNLVCPEVPASPSGLSVVYGCSPSI